MMRRLHGILTISAFLALSAVSLAAAVAVYMNRLPDPQFADSRDLFRWLVTRDVAAETPETQQKLLYRVEAELRRGGDLQQVTQNLDNAQKKQLRRNIEFLGRRWLKQKVDAYFAAAPADRPAELDQQIAEIESWGVVQQLLASETNQKKGGGEFTAIAESLALAQQWIREAAPQDRARMAQFMTALQGRVMMRKFQMLIGDRELRNQAPASPGPAG